MVTHKLGLLDNAVDSFNEALAKYRTGLDGDHRAYKFAILHFSHFLELLFKHYVAQAHPLLIYRNPFSKQIEKESTIGLWDAIQFLKNEGKEISTDFHRDLEWLKDLRNKIEHHKFAMNVAKVRRTLGRLTQALNEFNEAFGAITLTDHISVDNLEVFENLAVEYKHELAMARADALDDSEDGRSYFCSYCGNKDTAALDAGRYVCRLCSEVDPIVECTICSEDMKVSEGRVWNDDDPPRVHYICESCDLRIENA